MSEVWCRGSDKHYGLGRCECPVLDIALGYGQLARCRAPAQLEYMGAKICGRHLGSLHPPRSKYASDALRRISVDVSGFSSLWKLDE